MVDKIKQLIQEPVKGMDLKIYDIEFVKEGNDWFLKIYLDKDGGIGLNDIVEATNVISNILDEHDPIEQEYMLEVSSPGAERPLNSQEKLEQAVDQYIHVDFVNPFNGMDSIEGYLKSFDGNTLNIEYKVKNIKKYLDVEYANVRKARMAIKF